jgi:hypothetical protein
MAVGRKTVKARGNMEYRIIRADAEQGQIEVAYRENGAIVGIYGIEVPIVNGAFVTGDALQAEIMQRAPTWMTNRKQEVAAATGFELIAALVDDTVTAEDLEQQANAKMWAQVEFEQKIAKVLVKLGVLSEDPTTIEIARL